MANVTIETRKLGQFFACDAVVKANGREIYTTADYPYGHEAAATEAATRWAVAAGHTVVEGRRK